MLKCRVVPILLNKDGGLYKTIQFKNPKYVGDPLNAIRIFNEKEVDELIFLDIQATKNSVEPNYNLIENIASECFMPLTYGGGIRNLEQAKKIFELGIEKISLNNSSLKSLTIIEELSAYYGSQSIISSIDIKKNLFGKYQVFDHKNKKSLKIDAIEFIKNVQNAGAGEVLVTSVDKEGTMEGFDINLFKLLYDNVNIPMIVHGGLGNLDHLNEIYKHVKVSAIAAGSFFVFQGKHRAVLVSYPKYEKLRSIFGDE